MPLETKLLLACFTALAFGLFYAVTRVLGAWSDHHISRHDLIVESKRRRLEYFAAVAQRQREIEAENADIIDKEDTAPAAVIGEADTPEQRAA